MININIRLNKKAIIFIVFIMSFFTIANFVSVVDAESNGGITVVQEQAPIGSVMMWGGSTPPKDWLEMNGQSTSGYSELASIYGANLPDLRGEFVRGWDNGRGVDNSRELSTTQLDAFQGHWHVMAGSAAQDGSAVNGTWTANMMRDGASNGSYSDYNEVRDPYTDGSHGTPRTASETRPRNVALMYIVKAK